MPCLHNAVSTMHACLRCIQRAADVPPSLLGSYVNRETKSTKGVQKDLNLK